MRNVRLEEIDKGVMVLQLGGDNVRAVVISETSMGPNERAKRLQVAKEIHLKKSGMPSMANVQISGFCDDI